MVRAVLVGAALLCGCGGAEARRYAVTFTDASEITCVAETEGLIESDRKEVEKTANKLEKEWQQEREAVPPGPVGRELVVSVVEDAAQAWLDEPLVTYNRFGGTYFAGRDQVLTGVPQDDHIDVEHALVVNTDEEDKAAGNPPCGDRTLATSALLLTVDAGAVEGRLRRVENWVPSTTFFYCYARISCARNLEALGAEVAGP